MEHARTAVRHALAEVTSMEDTRTRWADWSSDSETEDKHFDNVRPRGEGVRRSAVQHVGWATLAGEVRGTDIF